MIQKNTKQKAAPFHSCKAGSLLAVDEVNYNSDSWAYAFL